MRPGGAPSLVGCGCRAVFGCALEIFQPVAQRPIERGLQRLRLGVDWLALPRLFSPNKYTVLLLVKDPDVDGDNALRGAAPHNPMKDVYLLNG